VRVAEVHQRDEAQRVLADRLGVEVVAERDPAALTARVDDPSRVAAALVALADHGIELNTYALGQPTLDEVFLALTGHTAQPGAPDGAGVDPDAATADPAEEPA
jgi:ABC-2 type transport system ATP-binding protein